MANGKVAFSQMTGQDSIDDSAIIAITNKDGKTRTVTFKTLRDSIQAAILVGQVDAAGISAVGTLSALNNSAYDIASLVDGEMEFDFSQIPPVGGLEKRIRVSQASDLAGDLDSTSEYFIDGAVDMGSQQITIPVDGLNLSGYNFGVSRLISSASAYTMFISPVGGSGNVLGKDYSIKASGVGSQVYDITAATGNEAFEFARINYDDCSSLGVITGYRQGLEVGTGRFGGKPELTLAGTWLGGFFIDTSIVRGVADGAYSLFKAGAGFTMASRFRSNMNIDLPASANFFDFSEANFVNPSTLQVGGAIVTRGGVFDATDANITPNIAAANLVCSWDGNNGMPNTFEGASIGVTTEAVTTINTIGVYEDVLAAAWTASDLQHFDNPAGNELRHLGNTPREYKVVADFLIDSNANDVLTLRVSKWDNSAASFSVVLDQSRQVNNIVGGRDVAFFGININTTLDQNDYIKLEVANQTSTANATAEVDSYYVVEQR
tara:strand:+ start:9 stop:1484 length:1476 start_codon:yes stop_codon:yes gene_type:complete